MTEEAQTTAAAAKPVKEAKPKMPAANGVTMPGDGTKTRRVWEIADAVSSAAGRPALRDEVMEKGLAENLSKGTVATQYGKWCTYYGVDKATKADIRKQEKAAAEPAAEPAPAA